MSESREPGLNPTQYSCHDLPSWPARGRADSALPAPCHASLAGAVALSHVADVSLFHVSVSFGIRGRERLTQT